MGWFEIWEVSRYLLQLRKNRPREQGLPWRSFLPQTTGLAFKAAGPCLRADNSEVPHMHESWHPPTSTFNRSRPVLWYHVPDLHTRTKSHAPTSLLSNPAEHFPPITIPAWSGSTQGYRSGQHAYIISEGYCQHNISSWDHQKWLSLSIRPPYAFD